MEYEIIKPARGNGKSLALAKHIQEAMNDNKNILFIRKDFIEDLETLKQYEPKHYDDVPDSIRYGMEYLGLWKGCE